MLGGVYQPGKALSMPKREEIINLYNQDYHTKDISQDLKVTERTVRNILDHFRRYGIVNPLAVGGSQVSVMNADLLEVIEIWKLQKASIYATEIQSRLLLEGICTLDKLPSITLINETLREKRES